MITSDTNFRGNFDSIEAVWEAIPYGGVEGDYLNIQGVKYRWNKYLAMWENAEVVTETPARETVTFDEDVNMQNNLTVAGVLRAKKFVVDDLPTGIEDVEITESAVSGGTNVITITYTNGESQTFNIKNGEVGKTMGAFVIAADALDKSGWDTAKGYLVLTETDGEFDVYTYEAEEWSKVDTIEISLTYDVDDTLSDSSEKPVQNKVITADIGKVRDYLGGDIRTLAVGQNFAKDEAVKTTIGTLVRMTKEVGIMNVTDTVAIGDLKVANSKTWKALKAIAEYDEEGEYSNGDYAIKDNVVKKYDGSVWSAVTVANMYGDSNLYEEVVIASLTSTYTTQNSVAKELDGLVNDNLKEKAIDWNSYSNIGNIIAVSTGKWTSSATNKTHRLIPVGDYLQFKIVSSATEGAAYTFLKDDTVVASGTPNYATGYSGVVWVDAGGRARNTGLVPDDAVYLYIARTNSGTNYTPDSISGYLPLSKIGYKVSLLEDNVMNISSNMSSSEVLNLSSFSDRSYVIAISTNKWSGGYDGKIHKLIPIRYYKQFKITASNTSASYYTFLRDDYVESGATPHYASSYSGLASVNAGQEATISVPSNAAYLYVHILNENVNYTPVSIYGIGQVSNIATSNSERISKLEENNIPPLAYYGGKIDLKTYHYAISSFLNSYTGHQSGAAFGDYYFMLTNKMTKVYVWNLSEGEIIYTWNNPSSLSDIHHCNQCSFGTTYYDANDPFPLLYVTVNNAASGEYAGRCSQEVYRVVATYDAETEEYTSFDFTLVQVIYLPVMTSTNCLGNANMAIDSVRNRMVFYSRDNNSSQGWCRITEFNIPSYTAGNEVVTTVLEDSNILNGYFIDSSAWNMQGGTIYKGKLFIARGAQGVGYTEMIVVDLIGKSQIATIDLLSNGFTAEPEGTFIWNNQVCISTNGSKFYNFTFE